MTRKPVSIPRTREQLEADQEFSLAPYAQKSRDSAGRTHPEPQHPYRSAFQRDRARIVHSRAFRRLEYKTQVFLNNAGDHIRTRLTHTIEVASLSRTIACALGANEDLAETIALAHDLGHAPYGHCGEHQLQELMREEGGFEHNLQSLRIVEKLEIKYPSFDGLNLSYEVLEGLRKHAHGFSRPAAGDRPAESFPSPSLEAQIANLADEITYYSHDLDDGLDHHLIEPAELEEIPIWKDFSARLRKQFPNVSGKRFATYAIRSLIDFQVADVIAETVRRLQDAGVTHSDEVRRHPAPLAGYSEQLAAANRDLRAFLFQRVYHHDDVAAVNQRGCAMIEAVFRAFQANPARMGDYAATHGQGESPARTICDYISGMTDRFLEREFQRLEAS